MIMGKTYFKITCRFQMAALCAIDWTGLVMWDNLNFTAIMAIGATQACVRSEHVIVVIRFDVVQLDLLAIIAESR